MCDGGDGGAVRPRPVARHAIRRLSCNLLRFRMLIINCSLSLNRYYIPIIHLVLQFKYNNLFSYGLIFYDQDRYAASVSA